MSSGRASSQALLRLLAEVRQPLYLLDEQRKIVFANQVLADWLGVVAGDLLGRPCHYQSGQADGLAAIADALCPPPEVFHGHQTTSVIYKWTAAGAQEPHRANFIPLPGEGDRCVGVLAIVCGMALSEEETQANHDPSTDAAATGEFSESRHLHALVQHCRQEIARWHHVERLVGQSPAMARVREQIRLAAAGVGTLLIVGPAGIGRQHVARAIHALTNQQLARQPLDSSQFNEAASQAAANEGNGQQALANLAGALMSVSCSALSAELLYSTISAFGERCQQTQGDAISTLLLTDIHKLPLEAQAEMVRRLAGLPRNLRVISTAPAALESFCQDGTFRADLAQRLSTLVIQMPPLAERSEDIPLLAQMFLEDMNGQGGKQLCGFKPQAMDRLTQYDWPGQVDELATVVRQSFAQAEGFEIALNDLSKQLHLAAEAARFPRQPPTPIDLEKFLAQVELELVNRALRLAKGNKSQAARLLGMTRPRLYRRMVQLGLASDEDNEEM